MNRKPSEATIVMSWGIISEGDQDAMIGLKLHFRQQLSLKRKPGTNA